jgi:signal transduction histidine kinase
MLTFDRRYVLLPMLIGVVFVVLAFFAADAGRRDRIHYAQAAQATSNRVRLLTEVQLVVTDAESAQRGLFLTGNDEYLQPYRQAKERVTQLLAEFGAAYEKSESRVAKEAQDLRSLIVTKLAEVDASLLLYEKGRGQAMALVRTDFGKRAMGDVRDLAQEMRSNEFELLNEQNAAWLRSHRMHRTVTIAGAALNVLLILIAGWLISRHLRRGAAAAAELESQITKGTHELSELSTYLQQISERERSTLARELHDELGSLLIGIKMDLSQLKPELNLEREAVKARWERVQSTLSAGIDLKRRVIEQLRPSLLDNMGLVAALRWQMNEICSGAGIELLEDYPENEPKIIPDAAIAFFRIAQEAMTNIVKHAKATTVEIALSTQNDRLTLTIEDNGIGIATDRKKPGSHGIAGMRHRLKSFDGTFTITQGEPGTKVTASAPMAKVENLPQSNHVDGI